jgi:hypothetical protein
MAFRMSSLTRTKSGAYRARIGIPADVRDDYQALYGKRWEELFHRPASLPLPKAKADHAEWIAEIESRISALRAKQRGDGHDLTQREARALAQHEESPGQPRNWEGARWGFEDDVDEARRDPETGEIGELDLEDPEVRKYVNETVHPRFADTAVRFLASRGEALTPAAMTIFLDELIDEWHTAATLLWRYAAGDYSPDQHLQTLPEYRRAKPVRRGAGKTCVELFRAYVKDVKPQRSTVNRWRGVFIALDKHLDGRNIDDFSNDEAQHWARSLVGDKRSAYTVKNTWISAPRIVLGWALKQKLVTTNAFAGVSIRVPKKVLNREDGRAAGDPKGCPSSQRHQESDQGRVPLGTLAVCV